MIARHTPRDKNSRIACRVIWLSIRVIFIRTDEFWLARRSIIARKAISGDELDATCHRVDREAMKSRAEPAKPTEPTDLGTALSQQFGLIDRQMEAIVQNLK